MKGEAGIAGSNLQQKEITGSLKKLKPKRTTGLDKTGMKALKSVFLNNSETSKQTKEKNWNKVFAPALIYGNKSWVFPGKLILKVVAAKMKILRNMEEVTRRSKIKTRILEKYWKGMLRCVSMKKVRMNIINLVWEIWERRRKSGIKKLPKSCKLVQLHGDGIFQKKKRVEKILQSKTSAP